MAVTVSFIHVLVYWFVLFPLVTCLKDIGWLQEGREWMLPPCTERWVSGDENHVHEGTSWAVRGRGVA